MPFMHWTERVLYAACLSCIAMKYSDVAHESPILRSLEYVGITHIYDILQVFTNFKYWLK